ncbi:ferritin-like domain-containing protein [Natranaerobius thermophilus]|uniref:Rubrerythrin n=1 Tax=Natranaerobius thermophilus (strain ATCC BAA-1301 / DSM 18059 / JW/NM-WN-LF) TaxID=457570 RepID=B2A6P5_NATTJ|nr:ferritin family protein [Natranaerobius thermophilus]ACB84178.1 Rubrerythrin [Natranaerobius thermophilus JW/NM-WN-LF]
MKKELELLKQAAINEQEGYEFYMMAAQNSDNQESQEALNELAQEEKQHKEWILELYEKFEQGSADSFDFDQVTAPSPELFRWENLPLDNTSKALSVFSIGVKMEYAAVEFYKDAKEKTDDPNVEKLLDILIDWERQHLNDFQKRYDELQKEWWDEQRFSPS